MDDSTSSNNPGASADGPDPQQQTQMQQPVIISPDNLTPQQKPAVSEVTQPTPVTPAVTPQSTQLSQNTINSQPSQQSDISSPGVQSLSTSSPSPAQVQGTNGAGPDVFSGQPVKRMRSKWMMPAIFAGALLFGGGAAAYVTVFQKTPEKLWARSLSNTADGLDRMIKNGLNNPDKGMTIDGSLDVASPVVVDGSVKGAWFETTGSMTAEVSVSGAQINIDARTIGEDANTTPDMYFKVSGLNEVDALTGGLLGSEAGGALADIDGQWFFLDKTLIDQALLQSNEETPEFTQEEIEQISTKVMTVMRDRMFASDESGVFTVLEKIGKEEFEGTDSYKVKVGVNKDNFKSFVTEIKDALKGTKAEELLKVSNPDGSLEEAIDFENLLKQIDDTDFSKATAEVWIEGNGGYIRNVRIYPEDGDTKNYIDFGMKYEGGDTFPLTMRLTMDEDDAKGTFTLGMAINPDNGDATMTMNADMKLSGEDFKMDMSMAIKGSNEQVTVEKPENAVNVLEFISELQSEASSFDMMAPSEFDDSFYSEPTLLDDQQLQ